jgi:acyl dehydratase
MSDTSTSTPPTPAPATSGAAPGPRHKRGGMYFEDFGAGQIFEHRYYRTVTQMDNMLFSNMTLNPQPLHIDRHFCATETEWGQPLMNSLFTLGDTLHSTTEVAGKRVSKSRPGAGIVELIHRCYNQDDKLVAECRRSAFIRMRPA